MPRAFSEPASRRLSRARLLALSPLVLAGAAAAQSSVTIWGVADVGVTYMSGGGRHQYGVNSGGLDGASKLGFKGIENLGGGNWAAFYLEHGFDADTGSGQGPMWNRRSTVSLGGGWGEVRLGRDWTLVFDNYVMGDIFGDAGIAASGDMLTYGAKAGSNPKTSYLINNAVQYAYGFAPNDSTWGTDNRGFWAEAQAAAGEGSSTGGRYEAVRVGYGVGTFNAAIALSTSKGPDQSGTPGRLITYKETSFALHYDVGNFTLKANGGINDSDTAHTKYRYLAVGGAYNLDANNELRAMVSTVSRAGVSGTRASMVSLGYVYKLSKRTALYGAVNLTDNGSATAYTPGIAVANGQNARGLNLGIKHGF